MATSNWSKELTSNVNLSYDKYWMLWALYIIDLQQFDLNSLWCWLGTLIFVSNDTFKTHLAVCKSYLCVNKHIQALVVEHIVVSYWTIFTLIYIYIHIFINQILYWVGTYSLIRSSLFTNIVPYMTLLLLASDHVVVVVRFSC